MLHSIPTTLFFKLMKIALFIALIKMCFQLIQLS
jgi:hypothetical protein